MRRSRYSTYRGDTKLRKFLKGFAVFLTVLLVICIAGVVFLQRYIVYTAEGPKLELPLFQRSDPPAQDSPDAETPPPADTMVIETPEPSPSPPAIENRRMLFLSREIMFSGLAEAKLNLAGATAAVYDMKADTGDLGYVSGLDLAVQAKVSAADVSLGAAITTYTKSAEYTVARISCFKDHKLSNADATLNITTNSGYRWTDPDNLRWSTPTSETVCRYLTDVCVELAQLGFDEILLDNATYPPSGNLGYIRKGALYDAAQFEAIVGAFYLQVKEALAPYDVRLSVMTDEATLLAGVNKVTGQSVANLAQADRIYLVTGNPEPFIDIMRAAGMHEPELNVIAIGAEPVTDAACWAVKEEP